MNSFRQNQTAGPFTEDKMTGQEIKNRRIALGLTQVELADELGISSIAIQHWENERRTPATPKMLDLALCWLESQQNRTVRDKATMKRINATIKASRKALKK